MNPGTRRTLSGGLAVLGAILVLAGCTRPEDTTRVAEDSLRAHSRWTLIGDIQPSRYVARWTDVAPVVDGLLGDATWQGEWIDDFVDIEGPGHGSARFATRAQIRWDAEALYIAADLAEAHLWATIRDSTRAVWRENDFEVFIDPDGDTHDYLEVEVNALNTRNQVHFPRAYGDAGRSDRQAWFPGFRSAVHLRGTINQSDDSDQGWGLEMAFPWEGFRRYATDGGAPRPGAVWRLNFARVQWALEPSPDGYRKMEGIRPDHWVWTPQGIVLMHVPEMWGYVGFVRNDEVPGWPDAWQRRARSCLLDAYYRGRAFSELAHGPAATASDLFPRGVPRGCDWDFEARPGGFILTMGYGDRSASIDHRRHLSFPAVTELSVDLR